MSGEIKKLNSDNFDDFVSKGKCVVDFWAEWCGPCRMLAPVFEEVAKELSSKVKFGKVDIDGQQELAERFGIMSVPSIVFFDNGEQIELNTGYVDKKRLDELIKSTFGL